MKPQTKSLEAPTVTHTPTPWLAEVTLASHVHYINALDGTPICDLFGDSRTAEANAALICKAVNAHATLVEMLEDWLRYAEENLSEFDTEDNCDGDSLCPRCVSAGCIQRKISNTRSALKELRNE